MSKHQNTRGTRAVLLTGASGGVGLPATRALAERGYQVFAGVRNPAAFPTEGGAGGRGTDAGPGVHPVRLDVTDPASVTAAVETVAARTGGALYALVNNAGVIVQGPMELVPAEELHRQFEVNVYGPARLTQACLPLLRRGGGRVVNITGGVARLPGPFFGAVSASKSALQALSDALRLELAYWDVPVVVLEPGGLDTDIFGKAAAAQQKSNAGLPAESVALYAEQQRAVDQAMARAKPSSTGLLVDAIVTALDAARPKARYTIGSDVRLLGLLSRLPLRTRDRLLGGVMGLNKLKSAA